MAEAAAFPYTTHLNIKFDPLTLIDVSLLAKTVTDQWYNQTLCKVNIIGTSTIMTTSSSSFSVAVS